MRGYKYYSSGAKFLQQISLLKDTFVLSLYIIKFSFIDKFTHFQPVLTSLISFSCKSQTGKLSRRNENPFLMCSTNGPELIRTHLWNSVAFLLSPPLFHQLLPIPHQKLLMFLGISSDYMWAHTLTTWTVLLALTMTLHLAYTCVWVTPGLEQAGGWGLWIGLTMTWFLVHLSVPGFPELASAFA